MCKSYSTIHRLLFVADVTDSVNLTRFRTGGAIGGVWINDAVVTDLHTDRGNSLLIFASRSRITCIKSSPNDVDVTAVPPITLLSRSLWCIEYSPFLILHPVPNPITPHKHKASDDSTQNHIHVIGQWN